MTVSATASTKSSSIPHGTGCSRWPWATACTARRGRRQDPARTSPGRPSSTCGRRWKAAWDVPISMTYAAVPCTAGPTRCGGGVGAAGRDPRLRPGPASPRRQSRGAVRHGHDRETRRLRRARQHHRGRAGLPAGGPEAEYRITGHKWFCSAPMCDAFLVLAQAPRGLSCFLLPRVLPDGDAQRLLTSSVLRTSSATAPTHRARLSSKAPPRFFWARRGGASTSSWRWSTPPGSTASSAARR